MKKIQKNRKMLKKTLLFSATAWIAFLARKMLKFDFIYFLKSCIELNFLSKTPITNQLEFKEKSYSQNTKQVQKKTQIQNHQFSFNISNGDQHQICSSLSNRLIPSLIFIRKLLKNKLYRKQIHSMKIFKKQKNAQKTLLFSAVTWIAFLAWKKFKFGFLYFWESCIELNFLSKNNNFE